MKRTRRLLAEFWYSALLLLLLFIVLELDKGDGPLPESSLLRGGLPPLEGDSCEVTILRCIPGWLLLFCNAD